MKPDFLDRRPERELLDHLPPGDPAAIASRKDLVRINFFMGNIRFILRMLKRLSRPGDRLLELGAGEALLAGKISRTALDLSH